MLNPTTRKFLRLQTKIFSAHNMRLGGIPAFVVLTALAPRDDSKREQDEGEESPLTSLAVKELVSVKVKKDFYPTENERKSQTFSAYHAAKNFAYAAISSIGDQLRYDLKGEKVLFPYIHDNLKRTSDLLRIGEMLYKRVEDPKKHIPLEALREFSWTRHDRGLERILAGHLREYSPHFPKAREISERASV